MTSIRNRAGCVLVVAILSGQVMAAPSSAVVTKIDIPYAPGKIKATFVATAIDSGSWNVTAEFQPIGRSYRMPCIWVPDPNCYMHITLSGTATAEFTATSNSAVQVIARRLWTQVNHVDAWAADVSCTVSVAEDGKVTVSAFSLISPTDLMPQIELGSQDATDSNGSTMTNYQPVISQNYNFQTVDAPGSDPNDASIFNSTWRNDAGLLVQQFNVTTTLGWGHTSILRAGDWSVIDPSNSIWCGATKPNSKGQVALTYASADNVVHIATWRDGSYQTLPDLPGYEMWARGINNKGQVVGFAFDSAGNEHGFLRDVASTTFFDNPLATPGTAAMSINDAGTIVGWYDAADGTIQSFRLDHGQYETIAPPDSVFTFAMTINNQGTVAGAYVDSNFLAHGFLLRKGTFTSVDVPGAWQTKIDSINDRGEIAGGYGAPDNTFHGFVGTLGSSQLTESADSLPEELTPANSDAEETPTR